MFDSSWVTKLHKLLGIVHEPDIKRGSSFWICRYTLPIKKNVVCLYIYSKDRFKTINNIQLFSPRERKVTFIGVGDKPIKKDDVMRLSKILSKSRNPIPIARKFLEKGPSSITEGSLGDIFDRLTTKILTYSSFLSAFLSLILIAIFVGKFVRNVGTEKYADMVEAANAKELFQYQTGTEPEFKIYSNLIHFVESLGTSTTFNGIIIYGPPGTGKTYVVRRTMYFSNIPYKYYKGSSANVVSVYAKLFEGRNKTLLLDDFDVKWTEELIGLLKAATDTAKKRLVTFPVAVSHAGSQQGQVSNVPQSFIFTGKIILVTNKEKDEIPAALRSRMPTIRVAFDTKEMLDVVHKMLKFIRPNLDLTLKEEVFNYLLKLYRGKKLKRIDFRTVEIAIDVRLIYPNNWREMILEVVV